MTSADTRRRLKGNWSSAILVQIVMLGVPLCLLLLEVWALRLFRVDVAVTSAGVLFDLLLLSPLKIGQTGFYLRVAVGEPAEGKRMIREFQPRRWFRAIRYRLVLWLLRLGFWSLFFVPCAVLLFHGTSGEGLLCLLARVLGVLTLLMGALVTELSLLRLMPARVYLAADPKLSVRRAFTLARRNTRGELGALFWRYLGFTGWLAACAFAVPYFYAAPLFQTTRILWVGMLPYREKRVRQKRL